MIHLTNGEKKFDKFDFGRQMLFYQIEMEIIRSRVVPRCIQKPFANNRQGGQILNDLEWFASNVQILKSQRKARDVSQKSRKLNITIRSSDCNRTSRAAYFYCSGGIVRFNRFNRQLKAESAGENAQHALYYAMELFFFAIFFSVPVN